MQPDRNPGRLVAGLLLAAVVLLVVSGGGVVANLLRKPVVTSPASRSMDVPGELMPSVPAELVPERTEVGAAAPNPRPIRHRWPIDRWLDNSLFTDDKSSADPGVAELLQEASSEIAAAYREYGDLRQSLDAERAQRNRQLVSLAQQRQREGDLSLRPLWEQIDQNHERWRQEQERLENEHTARHEEILTRFREALAAMEDSRRGTPSKQEL